MMIGALGEVVRTLVSTAQLLQRQGSHFNASRIVEGRGYRVKLQVDTGSTPSLWRRLTRSLFGS